MNSELLSALIPSTLLVFCSGMIFVGTILSLYVYLTSKETLYLSTAILGILGTSLTAFEASVIILGLIHYPETAYYFHRLQALTVTLFIPAMLYFVLQVTSITKKREITGFALLSALLFSFLCIIIAFWHPDYFLLIKNHPSQYTALWNIGRGIAGPLYKIRDFIIALTALISIVCLAIESFSKHKKRHIQLVFMGAAIAIITGIADMFVASRELAAGGLFSIRIFSYFSIGLSCFIIFSMIGVMKFFADRSREVEKARKLESLGILAGGIAHDFNNTLATIVGNISLLRYTEPDQEQIEKSFFEIENAAYKARKLTNQLLTFSKGGGPVKAVTDTKSILTDTVSFHLSGSAIKVTYDIPDNIWNLNADSGQITQVIQNIVINAKQAMRSSGTLTIRCINIPGFTRPDNGKIIDEAVKITFHNSGPIIPKKDLKKIFNPYFTTKSDGNGLGLSICYSIIEKHNGYIGVTSEHNRGTEFIIYLPASKMKKTENLQEKTTRLYDNKTALILEDDIGVQIVLSQMCKHINIKAIITSTGEEAIEILKKCIINKTIPDIFIFDLTIIGGMGGVETAKEVHTLVNDPKIIISSGYSNDPVIENYKNYGFCDYIQKPYRMQDFKDKILSIVI
ncbi:MAG: response regulator [Spirochaetes bacterium]|nr:response regulator [Spirochaetota bacterium]MBN2772280.1 response regulator [Spirochaetota bacterium]